MFNCVPQQYMLLACANILLNNQKSLVNFTVGHAQFCERGSVAWLNLN